VSCRNQQASWRLRSVSYQSPSGSTQFSPRAKCAELRGETEPSSHEDLFTRGVEIYSAQRPAEELRLYIYVARMRRPLARGETS